MKKVTIAIAVLIVAGTTAKAHANPVCDDVTAFLDGFQYRMTCGADESYSILVCQNLTPVCSYNNSERLVQGVCNEDTKHTVSGDPSQSCTITLHVQGVVEPKHYAHCTTYFGQAAEGFAQGPAAGGVTSGCYPISSSGYYVYMMHVSDSSTQLLGTAVTGTRYYWNAINKTEAHFSYPIDYTTPTITINGGQTIWMLGEDSTASSIKNCDDLSVDSPAGGGGVCDPITISSFNPAPGPSITQPFPGQFISLHVASAQ